VPTPIDTDDFYLAPGAYGMYVVYLNGGMHYTTGTTAPSNLDYQNCDMKIETGYGKNTVFSGGANSPRVFNGTLHYAKNDIAASGKYGYGCPGSNTLIPDLSVSAEPTVGSNGTILVNDVLNAPSVPGFLFIGTTKQLVDLTPLGMPACFLHHDALVAVATVGINGTVTVPYTIPNNAGLIGTQLLLQAACTDPSVNSLGVTASNGVSLRVGN
jgi:hypothetical protein